MWGTEGEAVRESKGGREKEGESRFSLLLSPQPASCWGAGFTHGTGAGPKKLAGSSPPRSVRKTFGEPERAVVFRSLSPITTQPQDPPRPQTNKPFASSIRGKLFGPSLFYAVKNLGSREKQLLTLWGPESELLSCISILFHQMA